MLERHFCSADSGSDWPTVSTVEQAGHRKHSVNGMFSHTINPMVSTRAYMDIDPVRLCLSLEALRQGKVVVLEDEAEESTEMTGIWVEDSGIVGIHFYVMSSSWLHTYNTCMYIFSLSVEQLLQL